MNAEAAPVKRVILCLDIAGGAGNAQHVYEAIVEAKADAVLAAGIFHFGTCRIAQVKQYLAERDIPVRL